MKPAALLTCALLALSACSTASNSGIVTEDKSTSKDAVPCPPITLADDAKFLARYSDPKSLNDRDIVSTLTITGVNASCKKLNTNLVVDLNIHFTGTLGPKSPPAPQSFTYPYFVTTTAAQGAINNKEVFNVTLAYAKSQSSVTQTEHLHHVIPLKNGKGPDAFTLGFQPSLLEKLYNQAQEEFSSDHEMEFRPITPIIPGAFIP